MMESLKVFGEVSEDFETKIKYAKWRATHIHRFEEDSCVFDKLSISRTSSNRTYKVNL